PAVALFVQVLEPVGGEGLEGTAGRVAGGEHAPDFAGRETFHLVPVRLRVRLVDGRRPGGRGDFPRVERVGRGGGPRVGPPGQFQPVPIPCRVRAVKGSRVGRGRGLIGAAAV